MTGDPTGETTVPTAFTLTVLALTSPMSSGPGSMFGMNSTILYGATGGIVALLVFVGAAIALRRRKH